MPTPKQLAHLEDVPVDIAASVPGPAMRVCDVLSLRVGCVIVTPSRAGDSIGLFAGGARIGEGELSRSAGRAMVRMVRFGSGRNG